MTHDSSIDWQAVGVLMVFVVIWSGLLLWAVKGLLGRLERQMDERFTTMGRERRNESGKLTQLERELLELKASMPRDYVMREDWIRFGGVMDAKLDAVHSELRELNRVIHERTA